MCHALGIQNSCKFYLVLTAAYNMLLSLKLITLSSKDKLNKPSLYTFKLQGPNYASSFYA